METLTCFLSQPDILGMRGRTEQALELAKEGLGWMGHSPDCHCPSLLLWTQGHSWVLVHMPLPESLRTFLVPSLLQVAVGHVV